MQKSAFTKLKTPFNVGEKPLQEYPRPQFERESYFNLNGLWDYAITQSEDSPESYDGKILVPFSPETTLSGVERTVQPHEFLHYRVEFSLPDGFEKDVTLLHFGAVDTIAKVYFNGQFVATHVGGYNSFFVDVSTLVQSVNELRVVVQDFSNTKYHTNGKQSLSRGGMWYSPQSGIWQTVWVESLNYSHLKKVKITPLFDEKKIMFELSKSKNGDVFCDVFFKGEKIATEHTEKDVLLVDLSSSFFEWTPDIPNLYDVVFRFENDVVKSYFAMRKHSVGSVDGKKRLLLNNKPIFHNGVLDQGYWPDSLYTAPSDEALIFDIQTMKDMGFNMLRKHVKVEPLRWYYHCDKLGMLVWQDMPSGGTKQNLWFTLRLPFLFKWHNASDKNYKRFSREEKISRDTFETELYEMIDQLYNSPCVACWVLFNEGWGQFDSVEICKKVKQKDSTRIIDHASGWHDQGVGDVLSLHVYFRKLYLPKADKHNRAMTISEFGGYTFSKQGHLFNTKRRYGYGKTSKDESALTKKTCKLFQEQLVPLIQKGLCASVYTQLSDVEDEVNGLVTYDRKCVKVNVEELKRTNFKVKL